MTISEDRPEQNRSVYKKEIQVRLTIVELMNEKQPITVRRVAKRAGISIGAIYNYVEDLERTGELCTSRQGGRKRSKILDMLLTEEAINRIYDLILNSLPENDHLKILTLLEKRVGRREI